MFRHKQNNEVVLANLTIGPPEPNKAGLLKRPSLQPNNTLIALIFRAIRFAGKISCHLWKKFLQMAGREGCRQQEDQQSLGCRTTINGPYDQSHSTVVKIFGMIE